MSDERPEVAIGHVRLHTVDVDRATAFYETIGMRKCMAWEGMAILELRGDTHLILIENDDEMEHILDPVFDLMVDDLEAYRSKLTSAGIQSSDVTHHAQSGHSRFLIEDPAGHRLPSILTTPKDASSN